MGKIKVAGIALAICTVLGGGIYGVNVAAEKRVREVIAKDLAERGLSERMQYGALSINPFTQQVTLSDLVLRDRNADVWRIDQLQVLNFVKNKLGYPFHVAGSIKGLHLPLRKLEENCGIVCLYIEPLKANGAKDVLVDMDMSYKMQGEEKRFDFSSRVTMRDYASFAVTGNIGGLAPSHLEKAYTYMSENLHAGKAPAVAVILSALKLGEDRNIREVDVKALGFSITDHGQVDSMGKLVAEAKGDLRPIAELRQEQLKGDRATIRNSRALREKLPEALFEALDASLEGYILHGKPLRFMAHAEKPVVLLRRGATERWSPALEIFEPGYLFKAFAPVIDNNPLQ